MFKTTQYPNVDILGPQNAGKTVLLVGLTKYLSDNRRDFDIQDVIPSTDLTTQLARISDNTIPTSSNDDKGKKGDQAEFKETVKVNLDSKQILYIASHDGKQFSKLVQDEASDYRNEYPKSGHRIPIFVVNPFLLDKEMALRVLLELTQRFQNRPERRNGFIKALSIASRTLFLNMRQPDDANKADDANKDLEANSDFDNKWMKFETELKTVIKNIEFEHIVIKEISTDDQGRVSSLILSQQVETGNLGEETGENPTSGRRKLQQADAINLDVEVSEAIIRQIKKFQEGLDLSLGGEYANVSGLIKRMPHSIVVFSRADIFYYLGKSTEIKKRLDSVIKKITPSKPVEFNRFIPTRCIDVQFDEESCRLHSVGLAQDKESCEELWQAIWKEYKIIKDRADWLKSFSLAGRTACVFFPLMLFLCLLYSLLSYPMAFTKVNGDKAERVAHVEVKAPLPMSLELQDRLLAYKMAMTNKHHLETWKINEIDESELTGDIKGELVADDKIVPSALVSLIKDKTFIDVIYTPNGSHPQTECKSIPVRYYLREDGKWTPKDNMSGAYLTETLNINTENFTNAVTQLVKSLESEDFDSIQGQFATVVTQARLIRDNVQKLRDQEVESTKKEASAWSKSENKFNEDVISANVPPVSDNFTIAIPELSDQKYPLRTFPRGCNAACSSRSRSKPETRAEAREQVRKE